MSNDKVYRDNLDMLRAKYEFKATYAKTLDFKVNDYFILHQTNTKHKNWWQVINERGEIGFIPSNYIETVSVCPSFYLNFLDNCIIYLKCHDVPSEYLISDKEEVILRLKELKRKVEQLPEVAENSIGSHSDLPPLLFTNATGELENLKGEKVSSPSSMALLEDERDSEGRMSMEKDERQGRSGSSGVDMRNSFENGIQEGKSLAGKEGNSRSTLANGKTYLEGRNSEVRCSQGKVGVEVKEREFREEPITPVRKPGPSKESLRKSIENIHEEVLQEERSRRHSKSTSKRSSDSRKNSYASPDNSQSQTKVSPTITKQAAYDLVENVRINTGLSHEMSRVAVGTVVQGLHDLLPASVFPYLSTILTHVENCVVVDNIQIDQTHDASRLKVIFNELTNCKEDSQQRSWMLHEDEDVIIEYLGELLSILSNADCSISKYMLSVDDFNVITTLIQYYQMEVRWSIRQLLLQAFGVMCSLDKTIISIMLTSVLPAEIARDMAANPRNIPKLNYSVLLLTMIYSMGEPMPISDLQYLGESFILFILNHIEYPPETDVDDQIPDMFVHFILSFNLQFTSVSDNIVLRALSQRGVTKTFTEKILLLLNREEDPARLFDHLPAPPNSVLKMFTDLFSCEETADIFYTNDIKVLIDIIVRNIVDLSPGEKRRYEYLQLCRRLLRTTNYVDHQHRRDDLLKCFTRIFCEESDQSKLDQALVRDILNEFPQFFK